MAANVFVGREAELQHLQELLRLAAAGQGQVVFIAGEAGSGKSALVEEFMRHAELVDPAVVAAIGECNSQTGIGDPYLPFRQVLTALTSADDLQQTSSTLNPTNAGRLREFVRVSSETLFEIGPDLIGLFVPGFTLLTKLVTTAATKGKLAEKLAAHVGSPDRAARASRANRRAGSGKDLRAVYQRTACSRAAPDAGPDRRRPSLGGQCLAQPAVPSSAPVEGERVLLAGAYRSDDVALGRDGERHPFEPILHELKRYYGDIVVNLGETQADEGHAFVDVLVDREPNQLGLAFRDELFTRTEGHPLFTVEMLHDLQERGDLLQDGEGRWVQSKSLDWDALPARIEGVIEERIGRLETDFRETLNVGSVVGYDFAAELVAQVQAIDDREMVRRLSGELSKRHQLVTSLGTQRLASTAQRLSRYRFRHILFQRYLYNSLDEAERSYLHEVVGNELERLFGSQTEEIAVDLRGTLRKPGCLQRRYRTTSRPGIVPCTCRRTRRLSRSSARGRLCWRPCRRARAQPARTRAAGCTIRPSCGRQRLCGSGVGQGLRPRSRTVRRGLRSRSALPGVVRSLGAQSRAWKHGGCLRPGHGVPASRPKVGPTCAYYGSTPHDGRDLFLSRRTAHHHEHLEQTLTLYDPQKHHAHAYVYGQDPGVATLSHGSLILWYLGYPDRALSMSERAIKLGENCSHPFSLAFALGVAAVLHQLRREAEAAEQLAAAAVALSSEQGLVFWLAYARVLLGWAQAELGQSEAGVATMRQGLLDLRRALRGYGAAIHDCSPGGNVGHHRRDRGRTNTA